MTGEYWNHAEQHALRHRHRTLRYRMDRRRSGRRCAARTVGRTNEGVPAGFGATHGQVDALAADAIDRIIGLLDGQAVDMTSIPLVLDVSEFDASVYTVCSEIPRGSTLTYGDIARRLGQPGAAQAVGGALGRNPVPIIIPCHRVLGAGTEVGGFSAPGGANTKQIILGIEGVPGFDEPTLF